MAAVTGMGRADRLASLAEAELFERHSSRVFGYCLSRLGRREDAEDATQLTFLHAVRGLRRGIVPATESAWLFGIARNVCLSRWSSAARRRRVESACDPSDLERTAPAHDPRRDELFGLERALQLLPEQQRRAVLLRDWRGLSYVEVAVELGVSHAAVETLIFRGRATLAEHLGAEQTKPTRRGRSLAALWSVVDAIKGAFAGAKLAATVGAAVTVSGGGIALGTTLLQAPAPAPAPAPQSVVTTPKQLARAAASVAAPATGGRPVRLGATASPVSIPGLAGVPAADSPVTAYPGSEPATRAATAESAISPEAAAERTPALEVPKLDPPTLELPRLEVPGIPAVELPSTGAVVAATGPVKAAVNDAVASLPPLPAIPTVSVPTPAVPALPTTPALPAPISSLP